MKKTQRLLLEAMTAADNNQASIYSSRIDGLLYPVWRRPPPTVGMSLQSITLAGYEPAAIMAALRRRFSLKTRRTPGEVNPYLIEASDDAGRIRLRLPYFWAESLWRWVYLIQRGDRL